MGIPVLHYAQNLKWRLKVEKSNICTSFSKNSWASASSPNSDGSRKSLAGATGRSQAALIERNPNHMRRATAAYSPIGSATDSQDKVQTVLGIIGLKSDFLDPFLQKITGDQHKRWFIVTLLEDVIQLEKVVSCLTYDCKHWWLMAWNGKFHAVAYWFEAALEHCGICVLWWQRLQSSVQVHHMLPQEPAPFRPVQENVAMGLTSLNKNMIEGCYSYILKDQLFTLTLLLPTPLNPLSQTI